MNKVISAALAAMLAALSICACSPQSADTEDAELTAAVEEATEAPEERVRLLFDKSNSEQAFQKLTFTEDLDGDGTEETVTLTAQEQPGIYEDTTSTRVDIDVTVGEMVYSDHTDGGSILMIYLIDLDPSDNAKEFAVYMMCWSADPQVEIIRWDGSLQHMKHVGVTLAGESYESNHIALGYVTSYPFIINDDGTFTVQKQTMSRGMWNVYVNYKLNDDGSISRIPQEIYDVVDIASSYITEEDGYAVVEKTLTGRGFDLYEGDRITVLQDDWNNHILIQKSTGESGWFTLRGYSDDDELYYVSDLFKEAG